MFFLFGSVLFGILLRKLNNIERSSGSVNYRTFPSYSFNEDMPYRLPRRSIDVNFRGIDTSTPTRTSTPPPGDEDLARGIARSLGGEYGTRHFTSQGARGARGGGRRVDVGEPGRARVQTRTYDPASPDPIPLRKACVGGEGGRGGSAGRGGRGGSGEFFGGDQIHLSGPSGRQQENRGYVPFSGGNRLGTEGFNNIVYYDNSSTGAPLI